MAARKIQERKPIAPLVIPLALIGAVIALYFGLPGFGILWLGMLISALAHPSPTPPKVPGLSAAARPEQLAAADSRYSGQLLRYRMVTAWRKALFFSGDLIPKPWPALSLIGSVAVALLAASIPAHSPVLAPEATGMVAGIDAVAAAAVFGALVVSRRSSKVLDDVLEPVTAKHVVATFKESAPKVIAPGVLALVAGIVASVVAAGAFPFCQPMFSLGVCLTSVTLAVWAPTAAPVRKRFWMLAEGRQEWNAYCESMKIDPPHRLIDRVHLPDEDSPVVIIDSLRADARTGGAAGTSKLAKALGSLFGGAWDAQLVPRPAKDKDGQDMAGVGHANEFDVVRFPSGAVPDITAPETADEVVEQVVRYAFASITTDLGAESLMLTQLRRLSAEGAPGLFDVGFSGASAMLMRNSAGLISSALRAETLVDHRANSGAGMLVVGAPDTELADDAGITIQQLELIAAEDESNRHWGAIMKQGTNPPVPKFAQQITHQLAGGQQITQLPYITRDGMPLADWFKYEPALSSTWLNEKFWSLGYFSLKTDDRSGGRHNAAFVLRTSSDTGIPSKPDILADVRGSQAPSWVIASILNHAFEANKLHRPEVVSAQVVARSEQPSRAPRLAKSATIGAGGLFIWKVQLRLYDDVVADVIAKSDRIVKSWAGAWLRVQPSEDGCTLWMGALPSQVRFTSPQLEKTADALDWSQVFIDQKMVSPTGRAPRLISSERLEYNDEVKALTFDIGGTGLELATFRGKAGKLKAASGNAWIDIQGGAKPTDILIRVCDHDPLPTAVEHRWELMAGARGMTFGVDIEGRPVQMDPRKDPHMLFSGRSGAGKSVTLQSMIAAAIMHGWELVIMDPSKGAADFGFAHKYARAVATDVYEAGAAMVWLYEEVKRRKGLNMAHQVGNYRDLPADVRPEHMVVIIDEFTSLMIKDDVPLISGDPEADAEREGIVATNSVRGQIGTLAGRIAREARSVGFSLVLATQSLKADTLKKISGANDLKDNLSRLVLGKASFGQLQAALKQPEEAPGLGEVVPTGRGLFETNEDGYQVFQSFYSPGEQAVIAAALAEYRPEGVSPVDLAPYMPARPDATPAVVDLAEDPSAPGQTTEFDELDFGDLDLGLDEDDEPDEAPAPETAEEPENVATEPGPEVKDVGPEPEVADAGTEDTPEAEEVRRRRGPAFEAPSRRRRPTVRF